MLGSIKKTIAYAKRNGIAAAYYGIPAYICNKALTYLDDYLIDIHDKFYKEYNSK